MFDLTVTLVAVALAKPVTLKFKAPVASNTLLPSLLNNRSEERRVGKDVTGRGLTDAVKTKATAWMPLAFFWKAKSPLRCTKLEISTLNPVMATLWVFGATSMVAPVISPMRRDTDVTCALYSDVFVFDLTVTLVAVALAKPVTLKFKAPVASNTLLPSLLNN